MKQKETNREYAHIFTCSNESTMTVILEVLNRVMTSTEVKFQLKNPFAGDTFSIWADNILKCDVSYYQGIARGIYELSK
jgi:hypothetical protein